MHTTSPTESEIISQCQHMMDCAVRFDIGVSAIKVERVLWCVIINEALKEECCVYTAVQTHDTADFEDACHEHACCGCETKKGRQ